MKQSAKKALLYANNGKVFRVKKTKTAEYFGVDAKTGIWEVRHDIRKGEWSCSCKNIRNTECCHIQAVKLIQ